MTVEIRRLADANALHEAGAAMFAQIAAEAVRRSGVFTVALAGGSTPRGMYSLLADDERLRNEMRWDSASVFWGDERHVPPDHPDSNYRMAYEALLSRVPISPQRVHRVRSEDPDARRAAAAYEADLRESFDCITGVPRFDLIVLGIGPDGHTASLFPGTAALAEQQQLVVANWVEKLNAHRITMTLPLLNAARLVMFMAAGEEKATVVREIFQPNDPTKRLPAQLVRPVDGTLLWLLDRAAATGLA